MIGKTSYDSRRPNNPLLVSNDARQAQYFVLGAEVVHATQ
jgi:hypothetical protein